VVVMEGSFSREGSSGDLGERLVEAGRRGVMETGEEVEDTMRPSGEDSREEGGRRREERYGEETGSW